ncbi:MAG TPA: hypothetical protein VFV84_08745 [Burkholderiales bacterium]|nr:hypothetical protein [Burkholderiales bacterium]
MARRALGLALAAYAAWVAATYLLEGLPGTLLRPEAVGLRLAYSAGAGLLLGILLPLWLLGRFVRAGLGAREAFGFAGAKRTAAGVVLGAAAGYALFSLNFGTPFAPMALANVFAQVWTVSVAEVLVCWALVGGTIAARLRSWNRGAAPVIAALAASVLFGVYHFAHSPPFNEPRMVAFLVGIGLATSLWFFVSRDVYGTAVFHNFFAVTGVLDALQAQGLVPEHPALATPVWIMALVATLAVALPAARWVRRAPQ